MPTYEFRCRACESRRDVRAGMAEADGLTLICLDCGGSMSKAVSAGVVMLATASSSSPAPSGQPAARARGASSSAGRPAGTCTDGAVRLTRPNPFRADPKVNQ